MRNATSGGVKKFPNRAKEWVMPWAKPRFSAGNQSASARVAVGKVAPSPRPRMTRQTINAVKLPTRPINMVEPAQMIPQTVSVRRAPNLSLSHPPQTCNAR